MSFNLEKILRIKKQNESKENDIVDYHYKKVVYKIKDQYNKYHDHCYYDIDHFIPKLPMYNSSEIAVKLIECMKKKKFDCKVIYQNRIYITWKPKKRIRTHVPDILKLLYEKIEDGAKNNKDFIFYEVPVFLSGHPWYDSIEATSMVAKKISEKGFIVKIFDNSKYNLHFMEKR